MTQFDNEATALDAVENADELPPPDTLFRVLTDRRRRRLLSVLASEPELELDELTDILAGAESTSDGPTGPEEWRRVKIALVHTHLPMLADADLLSYDDETVRRGDRPEVFEAVLAFASAYGATGEQR